MFDKNRVACGKLVTFRSDTTYDAAVLRSFAVDVETSLRSEAGRIVLHRGPIHLNASAVNSHTIQRASLDISPDDLLFDRILGIKASSVPGGIISADLPTCAGETVEVAVVAADVISLSAAAALSNKHAHIG